jgi:hypothetical protein
MLFVPRSVTTSVVPLGLNAIWAPSAPRGFDLASRGGLAASQHRV